MPEGWRPERKIVAGAVAAIIVWVLSLVGVEVPAEVAVAFPVVVGYLVPNRPSD